LIALLSGPGAGALVATDEAPLSDDLVAKAAALGNDPIQIYNLCFKRTLEFVGLCPPEVD
jgi:hypothetical protein